MRLNALISLLKDTAHAAFALHIAGSADSHGMKYWFFLVFFGGFLVPKIIFEEQKSKTEENKEI